MKFKGLIIAWSILFSAFSVAGGVEEKATSQFVINYFQYSADIATGGALLEGAPEQLKSDGFRTVLDLRTEAEGTAEEKDSLEALGLTYYNIPLGRTLPREETVTAFADIVENTNNYPLLIHCASGNRVGTVWALYRISQGTSLDEAVEEGRMIGMKESRVVQVKEATR